ncbi:MAG: FeoB-associated Cys-rich membrane protein [Clostridiales bacterium]|nr:FeoB-associated Cys-rich membrane protein [Clostridiales bacterium]
MGEFLSANYGNIIVGGIILAAVIGIIAKLVRDKKAGRSSCGCSGCSSCGSSAICHIDPEGLKEKIK